MAALHGALWNSDRWYRLSWYVWPTSLALLTAGWICIGKPVGATFSSGSWARPISQSSKAATLPPNWVQGEMNKCFSSQAEASGACTTLIISGLVKGRQLAAVLTQRGFLQREKQPDSALADYNAALKAQSDFADAFDNRAWIHMTRREYDAALQDLNKAIDLLPPASAGIARYYRGFAFLRLGKYAQALTDLNEAERVRPNDADIYLVRGEVKQEQEDYGAALQDFDEFSRRAPKDARGPISRGSVLEAMGRAQEALTALESAVALEPGNADALAERDRLRAQQNEGDQPK